MTIDLSMPAKVRLRGQEAFREWERVAHPPQLPPADWTRTWYAQGARGSGKTRLGAETLAYFMQTMGAGREFAAIGPTYGDARDTMVEHRESGLLRALGGAVGTWNRSIGEMRLTNGAWLFIDGADDGAPTIEGKGLSMAWCDEIGKWKKLSAWQESLEFALRMEPALIIATGTPKGKKGIVKLLLEEPDGRVTFTFPKLSENEGNLAAGVVREWRRRYAGTRLGRQELEGMVIADVAGALWTLGLLEDTRVAEQVVAAQDFKVFRERTVVAIDPATTANEEGSDETGIVVCRLIDPEAHVRERLGWRDGYTHGLILEDLSGIYSPTEWATVAVEAYRKWGADRIVAERNNGGDMVETTVRTIDPNVSYRGVWASKGKRTRAEPVSALYEQRRIHHVDTLPDLESEQTSWVPGEASPNRMDALVWGLTDLFIDGGTAQAQAFEVEDGGAVEEASLTADLLERSW